MSKRKDGTYTGSPVVRARIPKDEKAEFDRLCEDKGFNHSECIRWALQQARENDQRELNE